MTIVIICPSGTRVYCGQTQTNETIDLTFGTHLTHGSNKHVLGWGPNPFRWGFHAAAKVWTDQPNTCICLRTDMQYLVKAAWYGARVTRGPTCMYMKPPLALSVGEVNFDSAWPWKVNYRFLVRSATSAPSSVLVTVPMHFPTLPCHVGGTTKKWGGTLKKFFPALNRAPTFKLLPAPLDFPNINATLLTLRWTVLISARDGGLVGVVDCSMNLLY